MLDHRLRPLKDVLLAPLASRLAGRVRPDVVTAIAMLVGLGAAGAAWKADYGLALLLWLSNRILDGLDGSIARAADRSSDLGGYLDLVADFVVYAALPLGLALGMAFEPTSALGVAGAGSFALLAVALLLATFYVNAVSWLALSAILEKRGAGSSARGDQTTIVMPDGLIGGSETAIFFAAMLIWPGRAIFLMWLMAGLVVISVLLRVVWATRNLGTAEAGCVDAA